MDNYKAYLIFIIVMAFVFGIGGYLDSYFDLREKDAVEMRSKH